MAKTTAKKTAGKKAAAKKSSAKRTIIAPHGDKRFVRRNAQGEFTESDDMGKSLSRDRKIKAKTTVKPGYGDKGDQPARKSAKKTSKRK